MVWFERISSEVHSSAVNERANEGKASHVVVGEDAAMLPGRKYPAAPLRTSDEREVVDGEGEGARGPEEG